MDNSIWSWLTPLISVAASAVVSTVVGFFIKRALENYFKKKDEERKKAEETEKEYEKLKEEKLRQERKDDLEKILEKKLDPIEKKLDILSGGELSSLRNDILTCYYRCREKGYRGDWDYTNIHDLYESYKALNGNSFIDDVMKRFDALPAKEDVNARSTKRLTRGRRPGRVAAVAAKAPKIEVALPETKDIKIPDVDI